jgi:hypothetical protein
MRRVDGVRPRKAYARVKVTLLALAVTVGVATTATATPLIINSNSTWLATNTLPASTWNSDPSFDTTGWINAFEWNPSSCYAGASCIWYDQQFSATRYVWLRKTFTLSAPVLSAFLDGGVDDDADVYINGIRVVSDHNGFAHGTFAPTPIDIAAFLLQGVNLIAVAAEDNIPVWGRNHTFVAQLQIDTAQTAVPEPASLVLLASGLAGLTVLRRRAR